MKSLSRIFKSSYVNIGETKEIRIPKEITYNQQAMEALPKEDRDVSWEDVYREKLREIEEIASQKLEEVKRQGEAILRDAYEDAKQIYEQAKREGYGEGKAIGYEEGKREADALIQEALEIKMEIFKKKEVLAREFEKEIHALIVQIVEKILNIKLEDCDEIILGLVKLGLEKCTYTDALVIRVSPEDYGYLISIKDKILCLAENISDMEIKQDASLRKGSCVIDTVSGSIDSSIETQLQHMKEVLRELLESE
ncbi:Yop proteins translocation protein L [Thermotalea metallivorans]|uniref:Yop proteins translocation protein L n=1 Tax=Thermotalea metallivorans TaxID=520762 RepID=A0A140L5C0_9FIRM|nr:Yop proteins translocation protein L [Thermotalea metallivorans]